MDITSRKEAGSAVVRQAFGVQLSQHGRGFYVTLELLAMCWGTLQGSAGVVLPRLDPGEALSFARRSHDFARRWMAAENLTDNERSKIRGADAEETLRTLLVSLRVPIPHRRKMPTWGYQHLYPYVGELVHYDALQKYGRTLMERNTFRGGGGLAHKILRTDPEVARLQANRRGLEELIREDGGPLGRLANALASHDAVTDSGEFVDRTESDAIVREGDRWVEHLRNGVRNITSRPETPRSKQVELLMHWVPYCLARHQADRAAEIDERDLPTFPIAIDPDSSSLRQAGRRQLDVARATVKAALARIATAQAETADQPAKGHLEAILEGGRWSDAPLQFFTGTLAAVGALNAQSGRRHFTASLPLLESLIHATLRPGESLPYEQFCEGTLFTQLSLVVDPASGSRVRLTDDIDHGELSRNSAYLADEIKGLGLLDEYSDATRMVHAEVSR